MSQWRIFPCMVFFFFNFFVFLPSLLRYSLTIINLFLMKFENEKIQAYFWKILKNIFTRGGQYFGIS